MADYLELMTTDSVLDFLIYVFDRLQPGCELAVERLGGAVSAAWVNAVH